MKYTGAKSATLSREFTAPLGRVPGTKPRDIAKLDRQFAEAMSTLEDVVQQEDVQMASAERSEIIKLAEIAFEEEQLLCEMDTDYIKRFASLSKKGTQSPVHNNAKVSNLLHKLAHNLELENELAALPDQLPTDCTRNDLVVYSGEAVRASIAIIEKFAAAVGMSQEDVEEYYQLLDDYVYSLAIFVDTRPKSQALRDQIPSLGEITAMREAATKKLLSKFSECYEFENPWDEFGNPDGVADAFVGIAQDLASKKYEENVETGNALLHNGRLIEDSFEEIKKEVATRTSVPLSTGSANKTPPSLRASQVPNAPRARRMLPTDAGIPNRPVTNTLYNTNKTRFLNSFSNLAGAIFDPTAAMARIEQYLNSGEDPVADISKALATAAKRLNGLVGLQTSEDRTFYNNMMATLPFIKHYLDVHPSELDDFKAEFFTRFAVGSAFSRPPRSMSSIVTASRAITRAKNAADIDIASTNAANIEYAIQVGTITAVNSIISASLVMGGSMLAEFASTWFNGPVVRDQNDRIAEAMKVVRENAIKLASPGESKSVLLLNKQVELAVQQLNLARIAREAVSSGLGLAELPYNPDTLLSDAIQSAQTVRQAIQDGNIEDVALIEKVNSILSPVILDQARAILRNRLPDIPEWGLSVYATTVDNERIAAESLANSIDMAGIALNATDTMALDALKKNMDLITDEISRTPTDFTSDLLGDKGLSTLGPIISGIMPMEWRAAEMINRLKRTKEIDDLIAKTLAPLISEVESTGGGVSYIIGGGSISATVQGITEATGDVVYNNSDTIDVKNVVGLDGNFSLSSLLAFIKQGLQKAATSVSGDVKTSVTITINAATRHDVTNELMRMQASVPESVRDIFPRTMSPDRIMDYVRNADVSNAPAIASSPSFLLAQTMLGEVAVLCHTLCDYASLANVTDFALRFMNPDRAAIPSNVADDIALLTRLHQISDTTNSDGADLSRLGYKLSAADIYAAFTEDSSDADFAATVQRTFSSLELPTTVASLYSREVQRRFRPDIRESRASALFRLYRSRPNVIFGNGSVKRFISEYAKSNALKGLAMAVVPLMYNQMRDFSITASATTITALGLGMCVGDMAWNFLDTVAFNKSDLKAALPENFQNKHATMGVYIHMMRAMKASKDLGILSLTRTAQRFSIDKSKLGFGSLVLGSTLIASVPPEFVNKAIMTVLLTQGVAVAMNLVHAAVSSGVVGRVITKVADYEARTAQRFEIYRTTRNRIAERIGLGLIKSVAGEDPSKRFTMLDTALGLASGGAVAWIGTNVANMGLTAMSRVGSLLFQNPKAFGVWLTRIIMPQYLVTELMQVYGMEGLNTEAILTNAIWIQNVTRCFIALQLFATAYTWTNRKINSYFETARIRSGAAGAFSQGGDISSNVVMNMVFTAKERDMMQTSAGLLNGSAAFVQDKPFAWINFINVIKNVLMIIALFAIDARLSRW
jgi:hypothetical protein